MNGRWTFLKTYSLQVLSTARKVTEEGSLKKMCIKMKRLCQVQPHAVNTAVPLLSRTYRVATVASTTYEPTPLDQLAATRTSQATPRASVDPITVTRRSPIASFEHITTDELGIAGLSSSSDVRERDRPPTTNALLRAATPHALHDVVERSLDMLFLVADWCRREITARQGLD